MQDPKISIITVNFNKGNFIEDTILSVLNQDYPNIEYIIIDGASTDNSVDIIKKYDQKISYWVSEPDKGMTDALIKGFAKATGDIFAWINSDDTFLPGALKYVAKQYKKTKFDFLYGDCFLTDIKNVITKRINSYPTNHIAHALGLVPICQPSCFWSKKLFNKINGLNPDFHVTMDGDLFFRMLKFSSKTIRVNTPLSKFRIHPGQSGSWAPEGRYLSERKVILAYVANISFVKKMFYNKYFYKPYVLALRIISSLLCLK